VTNYSISNLSNNLYALLCIVTQHLFVSTNNASKKEKMQISKLISLSKLIHSNESKLICALFDYKDVRTHYYSLKSHCACSNSCLPECICPVLYSFLIITFMGATGIERDERKVHYNNNILSGVCLTVEKGLVADRPRDSLIIGSPLPQLTLFLLNSSQSIVRLTSIISRALFIAF
jgi:hypothetical protein